MVLGQYSISKSFPFFILITILIQATQAGRSTWLCCAGWLVIRTKMSMVMTMGMRSKTDLILAASSQDLLCSKLDSNIAKSYQTFIIITKFIQKFVLILLHSKTLTTCSWFEFLLLKNTLNSDFLYSFSWYFNRLSWFLITDMYYEEIVNKIDPIYRFARNCAQWI